MYILFLDESGGPAIPGPNSKTAENVFVFGGVILRSSEWKKVQSYLNRLKTKYSIPIDQELKWGNLIRRSGPAAGLTSDDILRFLGDLAPAVKPFVTGVATVVFKAEAAAQYPYIRNEDDIYNSGLRYCLQRFGNFFSDNPGIRDEAIVVGDHRDDKKDNRLRKHYEELVYLSRTFHGDLSRVIEGLFVQVSHFSIGVQLADFLVGSIYQLYEKGKPQYFDILKGWMRSKNGTYMGYGLAEFPRKNKSLAVSGSRP